MNQSTATFINLPFEVLSQILGYLIPMGEAFRVKTMRNNISESPLDDHPDLEIEEWFYSWTTKEYVLWASGASNVCPEILPLLLIHPKIYPLVVTRVYTNNTLWFPDLYTLREYIDRFSLRVKNAVKSLAVAACGREYGFDGCTSSEHVWEYGPEMGIVDALVHFPDLTDLRLGGIGPGLPERVGWSDGSATWPETPTQSEPNGYVFNDNVPPGYLAVYEGDDNDIWPIECITLVAAIVDISEDVESGRKPDQTAGHEGHRTQERSGVGPLRGGKVFCHNGHWGPNPDRTGRLRRMGTRIVRRGELINVAPEWETELTSVDAALVQATIEAERKAEYQRKRLAGEVLLWDHFFSYSGWVAV